MQVMDAIHASPDHVAQAEHHSYRLTVRRRLHPYPGGAPLEFFDLVSQHSIPALPVMRAPHWRREGLWEDALRATVYVAEHWEHVDWQPVTAADWDRAQCES